MAQKLPVSSRANGMKDHKNVRVTKRIAYLGKKACVVATPFSSSGTRKSTVAGCAFDAVIVWRKNPADLCQATTVCFPGGTLRSRNRPSASGLELHWLGVITMAAAMFECRRQFTRTI